MGGSVGTPEFVNTLGVTFSDAFGSPIDMANYVDWCYRDAFGPIMTTALSFTGTSLFLNGDNGNGSIDSTLPGVNSAGTGTYAPVAMAAICTKQTGRLGRTGKGRMFLPGVIRPSDVSPGGIIGTSWANTLNLAAARFYDCLTGAETPVLPSGTATPLDAGPVLLHSNPAIDPTPILGFTVGNVVGWIRDRIR
uniref:Uncharacterized protein n=1 Tax=uncultured prokaryote TaxID=198431 RepID=A0A0H5Q8H9_9ZZZZ|nr:hypothetical protein [uncultured prokaryote]